MTAFWLLSKLSILYWGKLLYITCHYTILYNNIIRLLPWLLKVRMFTKVYFTVPSHYEKGMKLVYFNTNFKLFRGLVISKKFNILVKAVFDLETFLIESYQNLYITYAYYFWNSCEKVANVFAHWWYSMGS